MAADMAGIVYVRFDDDLMHDAVQSRLSDDPACWVEDFPGGASMVIQRLREICREQRMPIAYAAYQGSQPVLCWVEKA